jgi:hypothetical protein
MAEGTLASQEPAPKSRQSGNVELVMAVVLGVLALLCFAWQVRTVGTHTTATETFLFNSLQFILTTGFAWFSTRAASRLEFEQSLKKFAISAYRRIADIERMVDRLHSEVREMISDAPKSEITNLRIVEAIVSDTGQLVRSSISDWADVIGEELLAIERIKRLEHEKELLQKDNVEASSKIGSELSAALQNIENAIAKIQSTLPPRLQLATEIQDQTDESVERKARSLARKHRRQEGLRITAGTSTGDLYPHERAAKDLAPGEVLLTVKSPGGGIDIADKLGHRIGRLLNETGGTYTGFEKALARCYGEGPLSVEFVGIEMQKTSDKGDTITWMTVKVLAEPLLRPRPISQQTGENDPGKTS